MLVVRKTSPVTGIGFNCVKLENGNLIIDNALLNSTIELEYNKATDSYQIPARSLDYIPTCSLLEASKRLNVSRMRISRMCSTGELTSTKVNGVLVIKSSSVNRWMEDHAHDGHNSDLVADNTD